MYKTISSAKQKNNVSPMMLLEFNGRRILLTGDSDEEAEDNFIENVNNRLFDNDFDGDVDVLKVAHHGGRESTKQELLDMLMPEYAMISCGENSYGHPRPETLEKLAAKTLGFIALTENTRRARRIILTARINLTETSG